MHIGDSDEANTGLYRSRIEQNPAKGNLTLTIECDRLLMPDSTRPGIFISKPIIEAAQYVQIETVFAAPMIREVKIKCLHVCGPIEFDEGACLVTLWGIGEWFVDKYQTAGKSAKYKKWVNGRMGDWADPDDLRNRGL